MKGEEKKVKEKVDSFKTISLLNCLKWLVVVQRRIHSWNSYNSGALYCEKCHGDLPPFSMSKPGVLIIENFWTDWLLLGSLKYRVLMERMFMLNL